MAYFKVIYRPSKNASWETEVNVNQPVAESVLEARTSEMVQEGFRDSTAKSGPAREESKTDISRVNWSSRRRGQVVDYPQTRSSISFTIICHNLLCIKRWLHYPKFFLKSSANQKIPCSLRTMKVYYVVNKIPPMNQIHTPKHFLEIHFNIILSSTRRFYELSLLGFSTNFVLNISYLLSVPYMPHPSLPFWFGHHINIWWRLDIMKDLV